MQIQWFPGHMHKARKQIAEMLPKVDLFIELLDARIPFSSENPMLAEIRGDKPCLKLLAKSDLADPERTTQWQSYLEKQQNVRAKPITSKEPAKLRGITQVCRNMLPNKQNKTITAMIVGIPNVGKSTLLNILVGRNVAKTGNEPAITKGQQKYNIGNGIVVFDTPGVLWPNVENKNSGFRLATTGAVRDTAMDYADVAVFAAAYLIQDYPTRVMQRYSLETIPNEPVVLLEEIGRRRGCLSKRGMIDYDRVSRILLNELRSGLLGPMTLETPAMMEQEKAELVVRQAEKAVSRQNRKQERLTRFKASQKRQ